MCTATRSIRGESGQYARYKLTAELLYHGADSVLITFIHLVSGDKGGRLRFLHRRRVELSQELPETYKPWYIFLATHPDARLKHNEVLVRTTGPEAHEVAFTLGAIRISPVSLVDVAPADAHKVPFTLFESTPFPESGNYAAVCHVRLAGPSYHALVKESFCTVDGPGIVLSQIRAIDLPMCPAHCRSEYEDELAEFEGMSGALGVPENYDVTLWSPDMCLPRVTYYTPNLKRMKRNPTVWPLPVRAFRISREAEWAINLDLAGKAKLRLPGRFHKFLVALAEKRHVPA